MLERVDRSKLRLVARAAFDPNLPAVLLDTVARLEAMATDAEDDTRKATAGRALSHLYKLIQRAQTGSAS